MKPSGAHTHSEMGGGGSGSGWLVTLSAIALAAIAGPVAHAIRDLIMVIGTAAVLTYRVRRRDARALTQRGTRALPTHERLALGRSQEVHLHFHGVSAEDVAAIIARQNKAGE
jgi:hypothetical protein